MSTGFWDNAGDPAGYARSPKWDTDWGRKAYSSYDNYTNRMKDYGTNYANGTDPLSQVGSRLMGQANTLSNQFGGIGRWGTGIAAPDDPMVGGYMANLRGGTYDTLNDYSKAMANAGIAAGRGGFGVAGGTPADSAARAEAMQTGARSYGDNYSKAMDWTKTAYGNLSNLYGNLTGNAVNAYSKAGDLGLGYAGAERAGIEGQNNMFAMRAGDYDADRAAQQAWAAGQNARMRDQITWEQQQRDAAAARQKQANLEEARRRMTYGGNPYYQPYGNAMPDLEYLRSEGSFPGWSGTTGTGKNSGINRNRYSDAMLSV